MEDNMNVVCPNCHTSSDLDQKKANSWRTMDPLESIVAGVSPVLLASAVVCTGLALRKSLSITLDYGMAATVFLVIIITSMPVFVWLLDRYEKNAEPLMGTKSIVSSVNAARMFIGLCALLGLFWKETM